MKKLLIIDFIVFGLLIIVIDTILAQQVLFGITLYVSISLPLLIVLYIRWEHYAVIMNLVVVILHMLIFKSPWLVNVLHGLSFLLVISSLLITKLKPFKEEKIKLLYVSLLYLGLYIVTFFLEFGLLKIFLEANLQAMLLNHSLNIIIGFLIVLLMYFQKDMLINMNVYIKKESLENVKDDGYGA